jgi:hypothetical protein
MRIISKTRYPAFYILNSLYAIHITQYSIRAKILRIFESKRWQFRAKLKFSKNFFYPFLYKHLAKSNLEKTPTISHQTRKYVYIIEADLFLSAPTLRLSDNLWGPIRNFEFESFGF